MISLRIRVDDEARRQLEAYPRERDAAWERWSQAGGQYVRGVMVRTIRSRQKTVGRTGQLSASVQVDSVPGAFAVYPTASYAPFVEDDTRPHEIRPRRPGGVLAFPQAGGRRGVIRGKPSTVYRFGGKTVTTGLVYARAVRHPGTKGMHFARDTAAMVPQPLAAMLAAENDEALRRAAKRA